MAITHFSTSQRPGWSLNRDFSDSRPWHYGPIPQEIGTYKGLYIHGDRVAFSYQLGEAEVLESPGFERYQGQPVFTRSFFLSPTTDSLSLRLTESPDGSATHLDQIASSSSEGYVSLRSGDRARLVGYKGLPAGTTWQVQDRHLILHLPAHDQASTFEIAMGADIE